MVLIRKATPLLCFTFCICGFGDPRVNFHSPFGAVFHDSGGMCETTVAGIVKSEEEKAADEEETKAHVPTDVTHLKDTPGVPDFWSKAIKNHAMLQSIVTEKD